MKSEITDPHPVLLCLMYHRFVDQSVFDSLPPEQQVYTIAAAKFESHLDVLGDEGITVVSLDDALAFVRGERRLSERSVLLTIDDGCRSALTHAAPILSRHGVTATLFVTTDPAACVFHGGCAATSCGPSPADARMSDAELRQWCASGFDVGAHGVTHLPLNALVGDALIEELVESRLILESTLSRPVTALAVPRGRWDIHVQNAARQTGYDSMFTSTRGSIVPGDDVFELARTNVSGRWSSVQFREILTSSLKISATAVLPPGDCARSRPRLNAQGILYQSYRGRTSAR